MRRVLLIAVLALLAGAGSQAQAAMPSCFGAEVDPGYVAAFDTVRGQIADGHVGYDQDRFYREAQSWATPPGELPGHHSEHFHIAACIPNGLTMTKASWPLDLTYTFHNVDDYKIVSASMSAIRSTGESRPIWQASPAQVATLQAAADASGDGSVQRVSFSVMTLAPAVNGWKEVRDGLNTVRDGPNAIFEQWHLDQRWYYTDNVAGLPAGTGSPPSQNAIRSRPLVRVIEDGQLTNARYHHAGWCGFANAHLNQDILSDCRSKLWKRADVAQVWSDTASKTVTLYVTDGGGPAYLMIDPDFHNHYAAPTAECPNVDAGGNCLGKWLWRPSNARQELFSPPQQFPEVTIPASVIASLAPGLHKLVFRSDDGPNCTRHTPPDCDGTQRGTWSNVEVLPFRVS